MSEREPKAPLPFELSVLGRYGRETNGRLHVATYKIQIGSTTHMIPHKDVLDGSAWTYFPEAHSYSSTHARTVLADEVTQQATTYPIGPSAVRWDTSGTGLQVPEPGIIAGHRERGAHPDPQAAWTRIAELLATSPRAALVTGCSLGGVYLERLNAGWFMLWLSGHSSRGKSSAAYVAASCHGFAGPDQNTPSGMFLSGDNTTIGVTEHLASVGSLPTILDEATAMMDVTAWQDAVFRLAGGGARGRASRSAPGLHRSRPARAPLITSAEESVLGAGKKSGLNRRVLDIPCMANLPVIRSAADAEELVALAGQAYGWPGERIYAEPGLEWFRDRHTAWAAWFAKGQDGVHKQIARNMAICMAGLDVLHIMTGVDTTTPVAPEAMRIYELLIGEMESQGGSPGQRWAEAMWESMALDLDWLDSLDRRDESKVREARGIRLENGDLAVRPAWAKEVARRIGLSNHLAAVRELAACGLLDTGGQVGHYQKVVRISSTLVARMYVLTSESGNSGNTGNTAGQSMETPVTTSAPSGNTGNGTPGQETLSDAVTSDNTQGQEELSPAAVTAPDAVTGHVGRDAPLEGPVTAPATGNAAKAVTGRQRTNGRLDMDGQMAALEMILGGELPPDVARDAVMLWRGAVRVGDEPVSLSPRGRGATGAAIYSMIQGAYHSVPDLPARPNMPEDWTAPSTTSNWCLDRAGELLYLSKQATSADVNAQFLAAASSAELGLGDPVEMVRGGLLELAKVCKLPGYVNVLEPLPVPLPYARGWVPTPVVEWHRQRGSRIVWERALVWEGKRRVLTPWTNVVRAGREKLLTGVATEPPNTTRARMAALAALKTIYATFLGGWMASEGSNRTDLLRPDWRDMIVGTARANAARAASKSDGLVGIFTDTAFFSGPPPECLEYTTQPGKWKVAYTGEPTKAMGVAASPKQLFDAFKAAGKES